ncbi:hypothetical protein PAXRUDRAFT_833460 [Paxillus rubicundulus Ve08.2h10]|uniref:Uncharacterized protein n=1 Tax=Paxillus rubicundulus Ve08.2h10 TaxID=930991 RepID=A0A0D0DP28_9AGAM|nr:hypothetical protein PAXRUDRAFT_833460 [Paxillus rubicundulus Ve08.2h10]
MVSGAGHSDIALVDAASTSWTRNGKRSNRSVIMHGGESLPIPSTKPSDYRHKNMLPGKDTCGHWQDKHSLHADQDTS